MAQVTKKEETHASEIIPSGIAPAAYSATLLVDVTSYDEEGKPLVVHAGTRIAVLRLPMHFATCLRTGRTKIQEAGEQIASPDGENWFSIKSWEYSADL